MSSFETSFKYFQNIKDAENTQIIHSLSFTIVTERSSGIFD